MNRSVLGVALTLVAFQSAADLQQEVADRCRAHAGMHGRAAVRACIAEDLAAAEALARRPETDQTTILRCRAQFRYLGWTRVKKCVDQGMDAEAALSKYPDRYKTIIEGCQIRMGAFGWHMVKACADLDIEKRKGVEQGLMPRNEGVLRRFPMWSRASTWIAMSFFLTISPAGISNAYADGSCEPLERLLVLADTQFRRLRGYYDPRLRTWVSTYRMPRASICTIQDVENVAQYSCRWVHDPKTETVLETYTGLLRLVTRCLNIRGSSQRDLGLERQVTRFGIADARKIIEVGKIESSSGGYFVTLDVVPIGFEELPAQ